MFTMLIYKDADFHIYEINEDGVVRKNGDTLPEKKTTYHSTNGYDYVLLTKFDGTKTMYRLDKVIYNSFFPETQNTWQHFKIIHLDGNNRNNNLYNLQAEEELEEWRVMTYPGIKNNDIEVSSFGNIRKVGSHNSLHKNIHGCSHKYSRISRPIRIDIHRLVAHEFITNDIFGDMNTINHIDNDGLNNNLDNLELVTSIQNIHHAMQIGVTKCVDDESIRFFCKLYVENNGDITKTKVDLSEYGMLHIFSDRFISRIIRKKVYKQITDEYFKLGDFDLPYKDQLSIDEVRCVCKLLVKNNGSCASTFREFRENGNDRIKLNDIKKIRYKYCWIEESNEFFIIDNDTGFHPIIKI